MPVGTEFGRLPEVCLATRWCRRMVYKEACCSSQPSLSDLRAPGRLPSTCEKVAAKQSRLDEAGPASGTGQVRGPFAIKTSGPKGPEVHSGLPSRHLQEGPACLAHCVQQLCQTCIGCLLVLLSGALGRGRGWFTQPLESFGVVRFWSVLAL